MYVQSIEELVSDESNLKFNSPPQENLSNVQSLQKVAMVGRWTNDAGALKQSNS